MEGSPGTHGVGRSSGLMRDCRNPGMESWRSAGGTTGCRSAGGRLRTEHTEDTQLMFCVSEAAFIGMGKIPIATSPAVNYW